jgi:hypothetical protein
MESSGAVGFGGIDRHARAQQLLNRLPIPFLHGVHEADIAGSP